jgi:hypothetical protein
MDKTLVNSGGPDLVGYTLCDPYVHYVLFREKVNATASLSCLSGGPTFELSYLAECMSVIHWGSHVKFPNIWLASSLVKCPPEMHGRYMSVSECFFGGWRDL